MLKPWDKIGSKPLADYRVFKVRSERSISPRTQKAHDFFVIDSVNWVNVVATTPDGHLVMIDSFGTVPAPLSWKFLVG